MRARFVGAFVVAAFVAACVGGCAPLAALQENLATATSRLSARGSSLIYVAPFVDETKNFEVGGLLTMTVQESLYERAPQRFLIVFDDAAGAVDGTVMAVADVDAGDGKRDVVVKVRAVVVDKRGRMRHDTGVVERRARYEVSGDATETSRRRIRARDIATTTVGRALVDDILRMP